MIVGADRLDAQIEPIAQFLLLIILLTVVAAIVFFITNQVAKRRRERLHGRLSASRRTKHSKIDLFSGADEMNRASAARPRRRRSSGSTHLSIDILKKPEAPDGGGSDSSEER